MIRRYFTRASGLAVKENRGAWARRDSIANNVTYQDDEEEDEDEDREEEGDEKEEEEDREEGEVDKYYLG
jgi:hypothetical protein